MTKASRWAQASATVSGSACPAFEARTLETSTDEGTTMHAAVGHRNGVPILCLTDGQRLGGLYLDDCSAVGFARWILDTFADEPAVNAHDALVAALEDIANSCDDVARVEGLDKAEVRTWRAMEAKARAALAQARGDQNPA